MVGSVIGVIAVGAALAGTSFVWSHGLDNSLHPSKTDLGRAVARRLADAPSGDVEYAVRALTIEEFRSYFVGLRPPVQCSCPAEALAYARVAERWGQPFLFRRANPALTALAAIYHDEAHRLEMM